MREDELPPSELIWQAAKGIYEYVLANGGNGRPGGRMVPSAREMVMEIVFTHPQGIMLKDIAKKVNRSASAVSQIIEALVCEGMVERVVSEQDRRAVFIHSTSLGKQSRNDFVQRLCQMVETVLRPVPARERDTFFKVLKHIVGHMTEG